MELIDLLSQVWEKDASDLHITVGVPPIIRFEGKLSALDYPKLTAKDTKGLIYSILSQEQREKLETNWEFDFSYSVPGKARFRVNAYYQRNSLSAAFRLVPVKISTLEELGLPASVEDLAGRPRGFVLVTGPTGSGKTTTLASLIDIINESRSEHIITVEDPIEFLHSHKKSIIDQRELGADTKSFANALKYVLRQDPDVILVGEMRDVETISAALTAAETGHLVFATLHTQDAPQTIDRIIDVFPASQQSQVRTQFASSLEAILSLRLMPGLPAGRIPAVEILVANPAVRNSIREGKTHLIDTILQTSGELGMRNLETDLANLVKQGKVSLEIAQAFALRPEELMRLVKGK